ncbi:MAG TPA: BrnT family toxin [Polyangia bacterium]|jgi:hypothetical protein
MPAVVEGDFEWDSTKAESNLAKHGVSFPEAATVLAVPALATRWWIGTSLRERLLYVVHVERGERDRIISARPATETERTVYDSGGWS